ncbi:MAG: uroporphyrinogen-III synthase, partial [Dehalococcoidales bacterium]|nr:uroporphyrinogen-III synthase [Dehalococcoidales bacterium]
LVTRSRHQASVLSKLLSAQGAQPVELPAIDIRATADTRKLDQAISNLSGYHWLIFTSVNGVEAFFQRLISLKLDSRALNGLKIGAIGSATASALQSKGIVPDYLPEVYTSQGLLTGLGRFNVAGQRFLLPRADIADKELTDGISRLGAEADDVAVYQTVAPMAAIAQAKEMLLAGEIDVITFTSSSTVSNLVAVFEKGSPVVNNAKIACIGPKTAETAAKAGLRVDIVAREQTIPGLVAAIEQYFKEAI